MTPNRIVRWPRISNTHQFRARAAIMVLLPRDGYVKLPRTSACEFGLLWREARKDVATSNPFLFA
jgi:hypothetical protein